MKHLSEALQKLLFFLVVIIFSCSAVGNNANSTRRSSFNVNEKDSILIDVDSLKIFLTRSGSLESFNIDSMRVLLAEKKAKDIEANTEIDDSLNAYEFGEYELSMIADTLNEGITRILTRILTNPNLKNYDIKKFLDNDFLKILNSQDKKIWTLTWFANDMGTGASSITILYYQNGETQKIYFDEFSGFISKFYKLRSGGKNLYMIIEEARSCRMCDTQIAHVIEAKTDKLNLNYPAFISDERMTNKKHSPSFEVSVMYGSVNYFKFDEKIQSLKFSYLTDSGTHVSTKEGMKKKNNSTTNL